MNKKKKSKIIIKILNKIYPKVPVPLNYKNTFTLLVSVLLSAQCTDVNVNNVTKKIYPKYFGVANTKIYIEKMCEFYSRISTTKFTIIRHSNIYGPFEAGFGTQQDSVITGQMGCPSKTPCYSEGQYI